MVFMETTINDLVEILKSDTDNISKEKRLGTSIREFVKNVVGKAFESYDDTLIDSMKEKGYQIEKKVPRTIVTTFGEVSTNRRRYIKPDATPVYPLDEAMGWQKYGRYSLLLVRNLSEFATKVSYRTGELAIRLFAPFTISHQKLNQLVTQAGQEFKKQQTSDERYIELKQAKRKPNVLYIEGDGFIFKGKNNKKLEGHRFQVSEGSQEIGKNRKQLIHAKDFVSLDRQTALKELTAYLGNTYHLSKTIVISNSDGGSGYEKAVFEELAGVCQRHEFFIDAYHVNRKIKERLSWKKELQKPLMDAIWKKYDYDNVQTIMDTAESCLIDECNTFKNQEHVRKLRNYLERHWEALRPFYQRNFPTGTSKTIGTCESNHRQYTYRMKGQGKYWSESGAEGMLRMIASLKNQELDEWFLSDLTPSLSLPEKRKQEQAAVRVATSKKWNKSEAHLGAHQAKIVGSEKSSTGMSKLARALMVPY